MDSQLAHSPTLAAPASDSQARRDRLPPGTACGEYVLDSFLGAGAMGQVYAGHHPVIGKKVAIKVLLATSAEASERFTREARAVNQVDHPNVIDVFAYGRLDDGRLYLVMDLVAGQSLRARLADGALEVDEALSILDQIADALDAAHARGVVHRDLKPDNIMVGERQIFVLDFGIARLVSGEATQGNGTLTGQGTWLGTPAYMAPEQWSTDGAGPASDRYALGVIAFELLSGSLPFAASSVPGMMEQHFRAKVPALSMRGSTNTAVDTVMQRALAKDPDARFATARELVAELRVAAGTTSGRASVDIDGKKPRPWLLGALGLGTLAVGVAGVLIAKGSPEPAKPVAPTPAPAGTIAVDVTSTPNQALLSLDGKVMGTTPATLHVAPGAELTVTKPGYLASHRKLDGGTNEIAVTLGAVTRFEGVWKLPTGELRAFERKDDRVAVSKVVAVNGHRELYKIYPFVAADAGVAFAVDDEVIDPRGPDVSSCHVTVHVEYRYDAARDVLELYRPTAKIDFVDNQCVPRSQDVVAQTLVRVDAAHDSVEITAPAGGPTKVPIKGTKRSVMTKPVPSNFGGKSPSSSLNNAKSKKVAADAEDLGDFSKTSQITSKPTATPPIQEVPANQYAPNNSGLETQQAPQQAPQQSVKPVSKK